MCGGSMDCADLYYASAFLFHDPFIYLETDGRVILVVFESDVERALALSRADEVWSDSEFGWFEDALQRGPVEESNLRLTLAAVHRADLSRVVVPGWYPSESAEYLRANGVEVKADADVIARRRRHKQPDEVEAIRRTLRVTAGSMAGIRARLAACDIGPDGALITSDGGPLTSEILQDEVRRRWAEARCEGEIPIVAGGAHGADGYETGHGALRAGEPIVCDLFPRDTVSRYYADMTRVFCVGTVPDELSRAHEAVRAALELARSACGPGVRGSDVYGRICDLYRKRGYPSPLHPTAGDATVTPAGAPYAGHGLGLDLHELTTGIEPYNHQLLEPGDVITLEPELYRLGWGAVRLEDVVLITDSGCETLTEFDYDLSV